MKIPNYLTIGRIIIVPIFVFAFYLPGFYGDVIPFALFVIAPNAFLVLSTAVMTIFVCSAIFSTHDCEVRKPFIHMIDWHLLCFFNGYFQAISQRQKINPRLIAF